MTGEAGEWLRQAEYDLDTAQAMLEAERYIYALFMAHLALEKGLKALYVKRSGEVPPKTHNLIQLLKGAQPDLVQTDQDFIATLNAMSVTTRYPEDLERALEEFTPEITGEMVLRAREVLTCLQRILGV